MPPRSLPRTRSNQRPTLLRLLLCTRPRFSNAVLHHFMRNTLQSHLAPLKSGRTRTNNQPVPPPHTSSRGRQVNGMGSATSRPPDAAESTSLTEDELEKGTRQGELVLSQTDGFINMDEVAMDENAFTEGACEVMRGEAQTGPATLCEVPQAADRMLRIELSGSMVVHAAAGKPLVVRFVVDE